MTTPTTTTTATARAPSLLDNSFKGSFVEGEAALTDRAGKKHADVEELVEEEPASADDLFLALANDAVAHPSQEASPPAATMQLKQTVGGYDIKVDDDGIAVAKKTAARRAAPKEGMEMAAATKMKRHTACVGCSPEEKIALKQSSAVQAALKKGTVAVSKAARKSGGTTRNTMAKHSPARASPKEQNRKPKDSPIKIVGSGPGLGHNKSKRTLHKPSKVTSSSSPDDSKAVASSRPVPAKHATTTATSSATKPQTSQDTTARHSRSRTSPERAAKRGDEGQTDSSDTPVDSSGQGRRKDDWPVDDDGGSGHGYNVPMRLLKTKMKVGVSAGAARFWRARDMHVRRRRSANGVMSGSSISMGARGASKGRPPNMSMAPRLARKAMLRGQEVYGKQERKAEREAKAKARKKLLAHTSPKLHPLDQMVSTQNCKVGYWGTWGDCPHPCHATAVRTRTRVVKGCAQRQGKPRTRQTYKCYDRINCRTWLSEWRGRLRMHGTFAGQMKGEHIQFPKGFNMNMSPPKPLPVTAYRAPRGSKDGAAFMQNVLDFQAFAYSVYDKLEDYYGTSSEGDPNPATSTPIILLRKMAAKAPDRNPLAKFQRILRGMLSRNKRGRFKFRGVQRYELREIFHAINFKNGVVKTVKNPVLANEALKNSDTLKRNVTKVVMWDYKSLGLMNEPHMVKRLTVLEEQLNEHKHRILSATKVGGKFGRGFAYDVPQGYVFNPCDCTGDFWNNGKRSMGHRCAKWDPKDNQPWCYVDHKCSDAYLSRTGLMKWQYCKKRMDRPLRVLVTTGAALKHSPTKGMVAKLRVYGSNGKSRVIKLRNLPKVGATKVYNFRTVRLGMISRAELWTSSAQSSWFFTNMKLRTPSNPQWLPVGPSHQWLLNKTTRAKMRHKIKYKGGLHAHFNTKKLVKGHHFGSRLKLETMSRRVELKFRTSKISTHKSSMQPEVMWLGTRGRFVHTHLARLPPAGVWGKATFALPRSLGKITGVKIVATSSDAWAFDNLMFKELLRRVPGGPQHRPGRMVKGACDCSAAGLRSGGRSCICIGRKSAKEPVLKLNAGRMVSGSCRCTPAALRSSGRLCSCRQEELLSTKRSYLERVLAHQKVPSNDLLRQTPSAPTRHVTALSDDEVTADTKADSRKMDSDVRKHHLARRDQEIETNDSERAPGRDGRSSVAKDSKPTTVPVSPVGEWSKLGNTKEWISATPHPRLTKKESFYTATNAAKERPLGDGCYCNGATSASKTGLYGITNIGGVCALHNKGDKVPWCYTTHNCAGSKQSKGHQSINSKLWKWVNCPHPTVPVRFGMLVGKAARKLEGAVHIRFHGRGGDTVIHRAPCSKMHIGRWHRFTKHIKDIGRLRAVYVKYVGPGNFYYDDMRVRYKGGFTLSFERKHRLSQGQGWVKLQQVSGANLGAAKLTASAIDPKTTQPVTGVTYMVFPPRYNGIEMATLTKKLQALTKYTLSTRSGKQSFSNLPPKRQIKEVIHRIVSLRGHVDRGSASPLGMQVKAVKGKTVTFSGMAAGEDYLVVAFKPGYVFEHQTIKTTPLPPAAAAAAGAAKKIAAKIATSTTTRLFLSKSMRPGRMMAILTWHKQPTDLDLYVVAPGRSKKSDTTVGGNAKPLGTSVNWSNRGSKTKYPYTVLDVDDMDGDGPETISTYEPITGVYQIWAECFSCSDKKAFATYKNGGAAVRVFGHHGLVYEARIKDAKGIPSKNWLVATRTCGDKKSGLKGVVNDGDRCKVTPVNKFVAHKPM
jgi:hypothetical protein